MRRTILAFAVLLAFAGSADAQTTRFRDAQGRNTGRAEQRDDTVRLYDAQGRSTGRAETRGRTTRHYDSMGRSVGRSETRASRR